MVLKITSPGVFTLFSLWFATTLAGCGLLKEKEKSEGDIQFSEAISKPLPPEKTEALLEEVGDNWLYGQGMGETALTAGTIVFFPPYALYVVGNGILNLSGYEEIRVTDALPEDARVEWNDAYDSITGGPGRVSAALAEKEFRNRELAKEKIRQVIVEDK